MATIVAYHTMTGNVRTKYLNINVKIVIIFPYIEERDEQKTANYFQTTNVFFVYQVIKTHKTTSLEFWVVFEGPALAERSSCRCWPIEQRSSLRAGRATASTTTTAVLVVYMCCTRRPGRE